jgi:hypothetical protein
MGTVLAVLCRVADLSPFPGISDLKIPLNRANEGFSGSMSCRAKSGRSRRVDKVLLDTSVFIEFERAMRVGTGNLRHFDRIPGLELMPLQLA